MYSQETLIEYENCGVKNTVQPVTAMLFQQCALILVKS